MTSKPINSAVSEAIKQEIVRFESVHPSIYAVYDIVERLASNNTDLCNQLKEHVLSIEDCFVNSHEWTLSRSIPDLRLGILGSTNSGKSALVHRYLTGTYLQDESPEGGRFKKEVNFDGQSYLQMIRDEGGAPDGQFSHWIDAVILVFSLEDELSLQTAVEYYQILARERQMLYPNASILPPGGLDVPLILVGTQDAISEYKPRVIDESKARNVAMELNRSPFFETCATYGLNVDRVFQEVCKLIIKRWQSVNGHISGATLPSSGSYSAMSPIATSVSSKQFTSPHSLTSGSGHSRPTTPQQQQSQASPVSGGGVGMVPTSRRSLSANPNAASAAVDPNTLLLTNNHQQVVNNAAAVAVPKPRQRRTPSVLLASNQSPNSSATAPVQQQQHCPSPLVSEQDLTQEKTEEKGLPTPNSTPTQMRKNRRKSNIFKKNDEDRDEKKGDPIGSGRSIPLKMGYLDKKSSKTLNKEWKKKYVTISDQGMLTYYDNIKEFQENAAGKTIDLTPTTVKIPGISYSSGIKAKPNPATSQVDASTKSVVGTNSRIAPDKPLPELPRESGTSSKSNSKSKSDASSHHKRKTTKASYTSSSGTSGSQQLGQPDDDSDTGEFHIVSLTNRHWRFWAESVSERDSWVEAIKEAIHNGIQIRCSSTHNTRGGSSNSNNTSHTSHTGNASSLQMHSNHPGGASSYSNAQSTSASAGWSHNNHQQQQHLHSRQSSTLLSGGGSAMDSSNATYANSTSTTNSTALPSVLQRVQQTGAELCHALRDVAGNRFCADCGTENPEWASVNLGIVLCIECAGFHRKLGTHVSRVRSIRLDSWPALYVNVMLTIGNTMANSVWEAGLPLSQHSDAKPGSNASLEERGRFIKNKYVDRMYLAPPFHSHAEGQQQLIDAIARGDTRQVILMLAINQEYDFINKPYSVQDPRLAIHIAATLGNTVYLQLLTWAFADMNAPDGEGRNAYFYAFASGLYDCAEFLLHSGCTAQHMQASSMTVRNITATSAAAAVDCSNNGQSRGGGSTSNGSMHGVNNRHLLASSGATLPRRRPSANQSQQSGGNANNAASSSATSNNSRLPPVTNEIGI